MRVCVFWLAFFANKEQSQVALVSARFFGTLPPIALGVLKFGVHSTGLSDHETKRSYPSILFVAILRSFGIVKWQHDYHFVGL